jgi:hypothetical protein
MPIDLQGDLDEAINYFSKAARQQSLSLPAYFERGNCYLIRKNFSLAVFDYRSCYFDRHHILRLPTTTARMQEFAITASKKCQPSS